LKENGGVIQTVAFSSYLNTEKSKKHNDLASELNKKVGEEMGFEVIPRREVFQLEEEERDEYLAKYKEVRDAAKPRLESEVNPIAPPVDVADFVDHIDYLVELMGIEHVGISSDFDGGGGISGWQDASETFNVTLELVRRGYSEEQIGMLWSGNLLRVLDEVQKVAEEIQSSES